MTNNPMEGHLSPEWFYKELTKNGIRYFCGVPDSSLGAFCAYLDTCDPGTHDIVVNEGSAIGLGIGHYVASAHVPLVYMQNSGLGNAMNPLTSLADPLVMGIPMLLLVGWRGEPGKKDEPQHVKQGLITANFLDCLGMPYEILSSDMQEASSQIERAVTRASASMQPVALLVRDGTFPEHNPIQNVNDQLLGREQAIAAVASSIGSRDIVVCTTGKASRELFEYREKNGMSHAQDLLIVGGMGHASSIAYGIAKHKPKRHVFIIDGDGAALMHMGMLPFVGTGVCKNLHHIVMNNGAHESVGGQPTVARSVRLSAIAERCGYSRAVSVSTRQEIEEVLRSTRDMPGPLFVEVLVACGSRPDLTRPSISPAQNKLECMEFLNGD